MRALVIVCLLALVIDVGFARVVPQDVDVEVDKRFLLDTFLELFAKTAKKVDKFVDKSEKVVEKILAESEKAVEKVIDEAEAIVDKIEDKTADFIEKVGDKTDEVIHRLGTNTKKIANRFFGLTKKIGHALAKKFKLEGKWIARLVTKSGSKVGHFFVKEGKKIGHFLVSEGKKLEHLAEDVYDEAKRDFRGIFAGIDFEKVVHAVITHIDSAFTVSACAVIAEQLVTTLAPSTAVLAPLVHPVFTKVCHAALHIIEMIGGQVEHAVFDRGTSAAPTEIPRTTQRIPHCMG